MAFSKSLAIYFILTLIPVALDFIIEKQPEVKDKKLNCVSMIYFQFNDYCEDILG
jgi:hypothetical protein